MVFELRTLNRSLQQKALSLGEESILDSAHTQPLSLLSEIQQSQVHTETRANHQPGAQSLHSLTLAGVHCS